jgi:hypothetical protein
MLFVTLEGIYMDLMGWFMMGFWRRLSMNPLLAAVFRPFRIALASLRISTSPSSNHYRRIHISSSEYLNISCVANVKAKTMKVEGRKAWVEGTIESLGTVHRDKEPTVYVTAKGLFIEPKYAAIMKVASLPPD